MATPALISFAKRANVSIETAETKWEEAKHEVDNNLRRTDPKQYWARVMWLVQKKLGLKRKSIRICFVIPMVHIFIWQQKILVLLV